MKKIILFIIVFFGIFPVLHKGKLVITHITCAHAEDGYSDEDDSGDPCDEMSASYDPIACADQGDDDDPPPCDSYSTPSQTLVNSDACFNYYTDCITSGDCHGVTGTSCGESYAVAKTALNSASLSLSATTGNVADAVTLTAGTSITGSPGLTYQFQEKVDDIDGWLDIGSAGSSNSAIYIIDQTGETQFQVVVTSACDDSHVQAANSFTTAGIGLDCALTFDPIMTITKDSGGGSLNGLYGRTETHAVDFTMGVCSDGTNWHPYLISVTGHYYSQSILAPGVTEVTGPSGNTTSDNFCDQMKDLENLGQNATNTGPGSWYMLSAVEAHENFHIARLSVALQECLTFFKGQMAGFSLPLAGHSQIAAQSSLTATAYTDITKGVMEVYWNAQMALDSQADEDPGSGPELAERAVTEIMVTTICSFSKDPAQNWPACPGSTCQ